MSIYLNFGPRSIGRQWCGVCLEDTLHKWSQCIHCTEVLAPKPPVEHQRYRVSEPMRDEILRLVHVEKLSQSEVARRTRYSPSTISHIVRGRAS